MREGEFEELLSEVLTEQAQTEPRDGLERRVLVRVAATEGEQRSWTLVRWSTGGVLLLAALACWQGRPGLRQMAPKEASVLPLRELRSGSRAAGETHTVGEAQGRHPGPEMMHGAAPQRAEARQGRAAARVRVREPGGRGRKGGLPERDGLEVPPLTISSLVVAPLRTD